MTNNEQELVIANAKNLNAVVRAINHFKDDAGELAGHYAYKCALRTGYEITEVEIEQHLEELFNQGAEFDLPYASLFALQLDYQGRLDTWRV